MMTNGLPRRVLIAAILVSFPVLAASAGGLPDLIVTQIELQPQQPTAGSIVSISAIIGNIGESEAESEIFVRFTVDEREINTSLIPGLQPGQTGTVATVWIAGGGSHTISVEVDRPYQRIIEGDETNNSASITVSVPAPGLVGLRIAVARFEDRSRSGFVNVGEGVADKLAERLSESGARV